jgi:hypothetical protein
MSKPPLDFHLAKTASLYVNSSAVVNAIISNTGEGKTYASVAAMPIHAKRCGKKIRCAIVRDTHENIKNSTAISIKEAFENYPEYYKFKNDFKKLEIYSDPPCDVDLFGIDDLGSLSKLQGPEYALIWLEEPAPMADKVNAGLPVEVFRAALVRCARQKGTKPRLQISMNPADESHWTYKELIDAPDVLPEYPLITKRVFFVPYGENKYVSEESRQAVKLAYKDDPASYARYVEGKFATIFRGNPVTPLYNRGRHLAGTPLVPARGLSGFAFFDAWHNPSCVLGQITLANRLIFIDTVQLLHSDIATLVETMVLPLMNHPRWKDKCREWRVGGDRSMLIPDQSNRHQNAAKTLMSYFPGCSFEPGPKLWDVMKLGIANALRGSDYRGEPLVVISKDNRLLDRGLGGAWHYKTDNSGNIVGKVPEKDEISHPCDAWANAVCVLLPTVLKGADMRGMRQRASKTKGRVATYAVA